MNKPAIFCWGRFQPPHLGHEELINYTVKLAKEWNGQAYLFASATDNEFDDPKKRKIYNGAERKGTRNELRLKKNENPLKWKDKHHILTLMFGKKFPSLKIISIRSVVDIPSLLRKSFHHRNLILVVGRDRYDKLEGLMRQKGVHVIGKPRSKITSGTDIRKSALQGNLNTVHSLLGKNISRKKAEHIVDLIKKNSYFAGKGYPGQGGRRTRRKRQRSRKKRGGRRRRKTHKKRRKKRTRRRRSRRRH